MPWHVLFHDDFHAEFKAMGGALQDELLAHARLLQEFDPLKEADISKQVKEKNHGKKSK